LSFNNDVVSLMYDLSEFATCLLRKSGRSC